MLKIRTKFRLIMAVYMAIPLGIMIYFLKDTPVFESPDFQGGLGSSLAVVILLLVCNPFLLGLKWLFMSQLTRVAEACKQIKKGRYTFFTLPNEPSFDSSENEMVALMRDMNWMIRQIGHRESELESQVALRTQELVLARDAANASARAKSDFLTTMSHEIRTPMNAIINLSGLALKKSRDPLQKEYLEIIHSSSSTLLGIINDILDFSKMDADKLTLESIPLNIRDLFEEITDMFRSQMSTSPVEMILDIDPAIPKTIKGDPLRLRQVVTNLVSNAVKFTKQGEILIRVKNTRITGEKTELTVSVKDTGVGIAPSALAKLFTPFTQEDGSTTREYGGTGLGLAISQKLAGLMGSEIIAESIKGQGTCFSFTLVTESCTGESGNRFLAPFRCPAHEKIRDGMDNMKKEPAPVEKGALFIPEPEQPVSDLPENIMESIEELGRLIEQNSLSAKAFSKNLAAQLSDTPLSPLACELEGQIRRFEFTTARQTFERLASALASAGTGTKKKTG